jgi:hypothetical protein
MQETQAGSKVRSALSPQQQDYALKDKQHAAVHRTNKHEQANQGTAAKPGNQAPTIGPTEHACLRQLLGAENL